MAEVGSRSTFKADEGPKLEIYSRHVRAAEYLYANPPKDDLRLWRLGPHGYEPVEPGADGRLRSIELGLEFGLEEGELRVYTPEGERIRTPEETEAQLAEAARERAEAEDRAERAARERAEAEARAQREAQQRAEAEARAALEARQRAEAEARAEREARERAEAEARAEREARERIAEAERRRELERQLEQLRAQLRERDANG